jgi:hypothetical protein
MKISVPLFLSIILMLYAAVLIGRGEINIPNKGIYIIGTQARIAAVLLYLSAGDGTYVKMRTLTGKRHFVLCAILICLVSIASVILMLYAVKIGWPSQLMFWTITLPVSGIAQVVVYLARSYDEKKVSTNQ